MSAMTPYEAGRHDGWYGRQEGAWLPPSAMESDKAQYRDGYAAGVRHRELVAAKAAKAG